MKKNKNHFTFGPGSSLPYCDCPTALFHALSNKKVCYIPVHQLDEICVEAVNKLSLPDKEHLISLLTGDKLSYGMAANRTFLLAAAFKADYLHRRDSDTYIQTGKNHKIISPLELELRHLGKTVSSLNTILSGFHDFASDDRVYMFGGGYKGNWPLDYEDLVDANINSLYKLVHLGKPLKTFDKIKEYVHSRYIDGSKEDYNRDSVSFSVNNFIDMGNISLYDIFNHLPFAPAPETTGTDYFYHALLGQIKKPMLYHNRRVHHQYHQARYDGDKLQSYHLRLVKSRCLARCYTNLYRNMSANKKIYFNNGEFQTSNISDYLIELSKKELFKEQEYVIESMVDIYKGVGSKKYNDLAEHIKQNKTAVIAQTPKDIYDHGLLMGSWKKLINFIKENSKEIKGSFFQ